MAAVSIVARLNPETHRRQIGFLTWDFVPLGITDLKAPRAPINERAETAATSPTFRDAFARRRCLVPADLFYEWQATEAGKQPFAIARTGLVRRW